ncbi:MAG: hypothetical protein M3N68_13185 [Actinomycetota bacterium]|nr:hypothetical protein [Actinomycetota bacterium]
MRKTLCGIAVGTLTLASPGIAVAQVEDGLVNVNVQDVAVSAPVTASGNQVGVLSEQNQTDSNNNNVNSTAGRNNDTQIGDNTTTIDDRDTTNDTTVTGNNNTVKNTTVGGQNNTVVTGDNNDVTTVRGDNNTLVDGDGNTVVPGNNNRFDSDDVSIVNRDGTVAFASRKGTVTVTDRSGKLHVLPHHKAIAVGLVPAHLHKHVLFPSRVSPGSKSRSVASGGALARTGQDYGLLILSALAMVSAGYVVSRLGRENVRPSSVLAAPADITLVVPDPDAIEASPEAEVEVEVESQTSPVAPVSEAADDDGLEDEIAKLRRQLAELAEATPGLALTSA